MSTGFERQTEDAFEDLSALVDGELPFDAVAGVCGRWRSESASRATWYAYQLIGDVLRSEDLASDSASDTAFLSSLRTRLANEPVVLAPQPLPAATGESNSEAVNARSPRWSWKATSAVAAGFLAVAGVLTVLRAPVPTPAMLAAENSAAAPPRIASAPAGPLPGDALPETPVVASGEMVRDAGLDRYLSAHKRFSGSSALGVPSNFLRSATVDAAGR